MVVCINSVTYSVICSLHTFPVAPFTEASDGYAIRRACIESGVALVTNAQIANLLAEGLRRRAIQARGRGDDEPYMVHSYREIMLGKW